MSLRDNVTPFCFEGLDRKIGMRRKSSIATEKIPCSELFTDSLEGCQTRLAWEIEALWRELNRGHDVLPVDVAGRNCHGNLTICH